MEKSKQTYRQALLSRMNDEEEELELALALSLISSNYDEPMTFMNDSLSGPCLESAIIPMAAPVGPVSFTNDSLEFFGMPELEEVLEDNCLPASEGESDPYVHLDGFFMHLAAELNLSDAGKKAKRSRKRIRRKLRRMAARADKEYDLMMLDYYIEQQGGARKVPTIISQNIQMLKDIGMSNDAVSATLKRLDLSAKVLKPKQAYRIKREEIQIRLAGLKQKRENYDNDRSGKERAQRRSDMRKEKYEQQSNGAVMAAVVGTAAVMRLLRMVNRAEKSHSDLIENVKEKLNSLASSLNKFGAIIKHVLTAVVFYYIWREFDNRAVRALLLTLIPVVLPETRTFLPKVFSQGSSDIEVEVQSGPGIDFLPNIISSVVLYFTGIKGRPNLASAMVDAISKLPRLGKGVECLVETSMVAVEKCVNIVMSYLNKPEFRFRRRLQKEVDDVIKRAWALDKKVMSKGFDVKQSPGVYAECMSVFADVVRLIAIHREDYKTRQELVQVRSMISSHCTSLQSTLGRGAGFRVEPVSVVIESSPGVGKTMQIPIMIGTLLKQSGIMPDITAQNTHEAFFTRPANSDYFDGYFGQECYYIDDLFAVKPVPGKVSHFEDIMAFYGNVTTMLNMAECDKKGMYPFTSSLLLMTTNVKDLDQIGVDSILVDKTAFSRRFDVHVHVEVKQQYQIENRPGMLDYRKYEEECDKLAAEGKYGFEAHPWYMWEAWSTFFGDSRSHVPGSGKCFSEVITEVVEKLRYKKESHNRVMKHLERVLSDGPIECQAGSEFVELPREDLWEPEVAISPWSFSSHSAYRRALRKAVTDLEDEDDVLIGSPRKRWRPLGWLRGARKTAFEFTDRVRSHAQRLAEEALGWLCNQNIVAICAIVAATVLALQFLLDKVMDFAGRQVGKVFPFLRPRTGWSDRELYNAAVLAGVDYEPGVTPEGIGWQSNGPKVQANSYKRPGHQAVEQSGQIITTQDRIYNQTYKIVVCVRDDGVIPVGQILFIAGNVAVMPFHFIDQIKTLLDEGTITSKAMISMKPCNGSKAVINTTVEAFLSYKRLDDPRVDLTFVNFNKGLRLFPNIVHHVLYKKEIGTIGGRQVRLDVGNVVSDGALAEICTRISYVSDVEVGRQELLTDRRKYPHWLGYDCNTTKGDCGAPLFVMDHRHLSCRCLAGLHVAGAPKYGRGFSTVLTQEDCIKALEYFKHKDVPEAAHLESGWPMEIEVQNSDEIAFTSDGLLGSAVPKYEVNLGVSAPVKSSLVRTGFGEDRIFDDEIRLMNEGRDPPVLVPMKMGSFMEDGEIVYPMEKAIAPFVGDIFLPCDNAFDIPLSMGMKAFSDATIHYSAKTLSFEEAVLGCPELGLKSLTRGTSVGYPLCLEAKNKKHYFGDGDEFDLSREECRQLKADVESLIEVIKSGKRPQFVCRDFLKDETRKLGKYARLIAGTDLRYYILNRMFFGAFVGAMRRSHNKSGICLGMNPYAEWGMLKRLLLRPDPSGENVWDGDFAGFDSSQMPKLLWTCLEFINNWYEQHGEGDANGIREILFYDLVYSRHIVSYRGVSTTIIEWSKSLPSGHFLTSTINSMLSMGLVASGFLATTGNTEFWENCAAAVLGDDNVVSTKPEFVDLFNQVTLSKHLLEDYGMVYTAGRKGEALKPVIGIDDVVFLQRRFAVKNNEDVCPIRPESFLHSLYFVKSNDFTKNRETLRAGVELALEELSMHDEKYWSAVAPKLVMAKRQLGSSPNLPTNDSSKYFELVRGRVPSYI